MTYLEKLLSLLKSRRFAAAILAALAILLQEVLGLTEEQVQMLVAAVSAWILGDSIKKTGEPAEDPVHAAARRFERTLPSPPTPIPKR